MTAGAGMKRRGSFCYFFIVSITFFKTELLLAPITFDMSGQKGWYSQSLLMIMQSWADLELALRYQSENDIIAIIEQTVGRLFYCLLILEHQACGPEQEEEVHYLSALLDQYEQAFHVLAQQKNSRAINQWAFCIKTLHHWLNGSLQELMIKIAN
jgi:hypothetical protein